MTIDKQTPYGGINISMEAIGAIAGTSAMECYGVLGLAPKASKDNVFEILKKEDIHQGIAARKGKDGYEVDLFIVIAFGVKVTEVVAEVQKKVKYVLEKTFDIKFKSINVYVQGIKCI